MALAAPNSFLIFPTAVLHIFITPNHRYRKINTDYYSTVYVRKQRIKIAHVEMFNIFKYVVSTDRIVDNITIFAGTFSNIPIVI